MTFQEWINNPAGKGAASIPNKALLQEKYVKDLDILRMKVNGLIMYRLYTDKKDWYIHFKMPSGLDEEFYYDVVVRFYTRDSKVGLENNLRNYDVQFYSNDPNFVYTYCYAYKSHGLLIKDLEYKMSKLALTQPAKVRNPRNDVGYVKTIFYSYLEMKRLGLFDKIKWEVVSKPYSKNVWNNTIDHADDKIKESQELADASRKKKIREKNKRKNDEFERNIPVSRNNLTSNFKSPNQKNFGHFKKEAPAKFDKIVNNIKGFGHFKKNK